MWARCEGFWQQSFQNSLEKMALSLLLDLEKPIQFRVEVRECELLGRVRHVQRPRVPLLEGPRGPVVSLEILLPSLFSKGPGAPICSFVSCQDMETWECRSRKGHLLTIKGLFLLSIWGWGTDE